MSHLRSSRLCSLRAGFVVAALVVLLPGLTACGSEKRSTGTTASAAPWTEVLAATIHPGDEVPAPRGKVVLTFTGTPVTNVGNQLRLDFELLERMGVVEYTVFDRQAEGHDVTFSGPLLRDVLDVAGVAHDASLHCLALNDYDVHVPAADAWELPVLLATRADGERMSVKHYGPTRFIYPTKDVDLDRTIYDPRWVWQLETIDVGPRPAGPDR